MNGAADATRSMHSWVHRNRRRLEAIYGLRGTRVARARAHGQAPGALAGLLGAAATAIGEAGARLRVHLLVPARTPDGYGGRGRETNPPTLGR